MESFKKWLEALATAPIISPPDASKPLRSKIKGTNPNDAAGRWLHDQGVNPRNLKNTTDSWNVPMSRTRPPAPAPRPRPTASIAAHVPSLPQSKEEPSLPQSKDIFPTQPAGEEFIKLWQQYGQGQSPAEYLQTIQQGYVAGPERGKYDSKTGTYANDPPVPKTIIKKNLNHLFHGKSRAEVSRASGVPAPWIIQVLNYGIAKPTPKAQQRLGLLANYFRVTVDDLWNPEMQSDSV
jgi:hypothetical protein